MGVGFYTYMPDEGTQHYTVVCAFERCLTPLSNSANILSKDFQAASGRAFLFRKVVNVKLGVVETQDMLTGRHQVRSVYCKKCETKLGWFYEMAFTPSQRYKESCTVLECLRIRRVQPLPPITAYRCDYGKRESGYIDEMNEVALSPIIINPAGLDTSDEDSEDHFDDQEMNADLIIEGVMEAMEME